MAKRSKKQTPQEIDSRIAEIEAELGAGGGGGDPTSEGFEPSRALAVGFDDLLFNVPRNLSPRLGQFIEETEEGFPEERSLGRALGIAGSFTKASPVGLAGTAIQMARKGQKAKALADTFLRRSLRGAAVGGAGAAGETAVRGQMTGTPVSAEDLLLAGGMGAAGGAFAENLASSASRAGRAAEEAQLDVAIPGAKGRKAQVGEFREAQKERALQTGDPLDVEGPVRTEEITDVVRTGESRDRFMGRTKVTELPKLSRRVDDILDRAEKKVGTTTFTGAEIKQQVKLSPALRQAINKQPTAKRAEFERFVDQQLDSLFPDNTRMRPKELLEERRAISAQIDERSTDKLSDQIVVSNSRASTQAEKEVERAAVSAIKNMLEDFAGSAGLKDELRSVNRRIQVINEARRRIADPKAELSLTEQVTRGVGSPLSFLLSGGLASVAPFPSNVALAALGAGGGAFLGKTLPVSSTVAKGLRFARRAAPAVVGAPGLVSGASRTASEVALSEAEQDLLDEVRRIRRSGK